MCIVACLQKYCLLETMILSCLLFLFPQKVALLNVASVSFTVHLPLALKLLNCTALQSLSPTVYNSFVLIGDFNVDYFCTHATLYNRLTYCLAPFSLYQVVSHATHVSPNGSTLYSCLTYLSYVIVRSSLHWQTQIIMEYSWNLQVL